MFGEHLKRCREYRHYTVAELARIANVYHNKIARLEKGKHHSIKIDDAVKIARALGTTVEALVDGTAPMASTNHDSA